VKIFPIEAMLDGVSSAVGKPEAFPVKGLAVFGQKNRARKIICRRVALRDLAGASGERSRDLTGNRLLDGGT
jgi:hypothetical protein